MMTMGSRQQQQQQQQQQQHAVKRPRVDRGEAGMPGGAVHSPADMGNDAMMHRFDHFLGVPMKYEDVEIMPGPVRNDVMVLLREVKWNDAKINDHADLNDIDIGEFESRYEKFGRALMTLEDWFERKGIQSNELNDFAKKNRSMFACLSAALTNMTLWKNRCLVRIAEKKKVSDYERVIRHLIHKILIDDLRLKDTTLYARILNRGGVETAAWKSCLPMEEYIWRATRTDDLWSASIKDRTVENAKNYFLKSKDPHLPRLNKCKWFFSYNNGLFDALEGGFHAYPLADDSPYKAVGSSTPAKHFPDMDFPTGTWRKLVSGEITWEDIDTPVLDGVFVTQKITGDELKFMYYMIGRWFFKSGQLERWQVTLWIVGLAGTGKSSLITLLRFFYELEDVATLSNNMEKQFGLGSVNIQDKFCFVGPEIRNDFKLEISELLSMLTPGEVMSIAKKFEDARMASVEATGLLCGNIFPDNIVPGSVDAVSRRTVLARFMESVPHEDPNMDKKLEEESPYILLKTSWGLREYTSVESNRTNVWKHIPKYFQDTKLALEHSLDPLRHFINSPSVALGEDYEVGFSDFQCAFNNHCKVNIFRKVKLIESNYSSTFKKNNLRVVDNEAGMRTVKGMRLTAFASREHMGGGVDES